MSAGARPAGLPDGLELADGRDSGGSGGNRGLSQDFLAALCLVLVIEGMLPFLMPGRWRDMVLALAHTDERTIRIVGLVSMILGAVLLYWVK